MDRSYDVAIVGLGAMGSACAYHFARRGARVLGLDRFAPPHPFGSSHGETRIIREAYFEDPRYVPLVQRAYRLWRELERAAGEKLLVETGGLMVGPPDGVLVRGARTSAETHGLPHERLTAGEIERRFPVFTPRDDVVGVGGARRGEGVRVTQRLRGLPVLAVSAVQVAAQHAEAERLGAGERMVEGLLLDRITDERGDVS